MALLLWVAGAIAWFVPLRELAVAIWAVNLVNAAFSFWQEYRAERAIGSPRTRCCSTGPPSRSTSPC
jgi:magnesium-transporting ATPase (P-type)